MTDETPYTPGVARDHEFEEELVAAAPAQERIRIDDIGEVRVEISAELGQCEILVREILALKEGTILPIDKVAGEMADLFLNGVPFARGEVVVMVDSLHVRIAEVIGVMEKDTGHA